MNSVLRTAVSLAVFAHCVLTSDWAARADQPNTIITNQPSFRIPYRFDAEEMRRLRAKEIRLFLSRNAGLDWQHIQTVAPEAGRFDFRAPADGEYWFAVRTVDSTNQLHPDANVVEPGLVVVIDRVAPDLQLLLQSPEPGRVQLSWSASDANLDLEKLNLEFSEGGAAWQAVKVNRQAAGQTSWSVPNGGQVAVRGSIADRAGNVGSAQTSVIVQAGVVGDPMRRRPDAADYNQPIAGSRPGSPQESSHNYPFGPSADVRSSSAPPADPFSSFLAPSGRSVAPAQTQFSQEASIANAFSTPATMTSTAQNPSRFNTTQWATPTGRVGPNNRVRAVKSTRFEINYRIDDVGPSGVSAVELFITQNNGQKWWKYGDDADKQSPIVVNVPEDGVYGFAIRVRSGVGLMDPPPQPGEEPAIVVVVDHTPPTVQLLPVQQGAGGQLNRLTISWQVRDDNPSDKPVSLAYSANPNGPWEPICGWQPDTGSYTWNLGPGIPSRLYIRLIARDAAGNHSFVDTPQPLMVDLSKPTARIIDVDANAAQ
jgi:hypothetical protein